MANKKKHKQLQESETKQNTTENSSIERSDRMELEGIVEEALPGTLFKVKTTTGSTVLAVLAGKLRMNHIHVLVGDYVALEVSPYDLTRGRIMWRR